MSRYPSAVRAVTADMKPVLLEAIEHGWQATITGGGHVRLQHPQHGVVFCGCSASDWRAVHNLKRDIRQAEAGMRPPRCSPPPRSIQKQKEKMTHGI